MPKVSVVIPCYNQGEYLDQAVDSVLAQSFRDFEIIVVNDGSSDENTNRLLADYRRPLTRVIVTPNQGPSAARNTGIRESTGQYVLPLDADDLIAPTYLEQAVAVLDARPEVGIVYCRGEKFGAANGPWMSDDYSLRRMLIGNQIFCSGFFRKSAWERVGGYRESMKHGWEDWDFWLSLIESGSQVFRIPEVLFRYRIKQVSRTTQLDLDRQIEMHLQVMRNHKELYIENARPLLELYYRICASRPYRLLKKLGLPRLIGRLPGGRK
jgi:glycosyltransferase involved in cell wall biosynthesis